MMSLVHLALYFCCSCLEVGMTHSLDQRDVARLHAIASLLFLSFPTSTLCQETTPTQLITGIESFSCSLSVHDMRVCLQTAAQVVRLI